MSGESKGRLLCFGIMCEHILHASADMPGHRFFGGLRLTVPDGLENIDMFMGRDLKMMLL